MIWGELTWKDMSALNNRILKNQWTAALGTKLNQYFNNNIINSKIRAIYGFLRIN